ncbi:endonuclease VII domain-containing protein [Streptomyces bambusae]|uniref:endonuclease domain-containing protein n=1 Tax=Streptomyces bambusae TaxID=1550616 RepID=UPI001CFD7FA0|nr:endonuclease VII domain-containing protein [Streptomyces bambusae]
MDWETDEELFAYAESLGERCTVCSDILWRIEAGSKGKKCPQCRNAIRQARRHNLTLARVNAILRAQDDTCPLCGRNGGDLSWEGPSWWHIDHDHNCCRRGSSCGQCVRGLLCRGCNIRGLAWYEALPEDLQTWDHINVYLANPPARRPEAAVLFHGDLRGVRSRDGCFAGWRSDQPLAP